MPPNDALICKVCGMPMVKDKDFGTNADGSKNEDYCVYCYKDGKFTQDLTMGQMIEKLANMEIPEWLGLDGKPPTREEKVAMMKEGFSNLKRWRQG